MGSSQKDFLMLNGAIMAATPTPSAVKDRDTKRRDRRKSKLVRLVWSWFLDTDLESIEKVALLSNIGVVLGLIRFGNRFIAVPPPWLNHFVPTAPIWVWVTCLSTGVVCEFYGFVSGNDCMRRNGAVSTFLAFCGMIGPLFIKTPVLASAVAFGMIWMATIAVRLCRLCQVQAENKSNPCQ